MKDTINLYNHWHYGDIFLSRMLIKGLSKKFKINFYHNLKPGLFKDLDDVKEIIGVPKNFSLHNSNLENNIVNTWIGQNNMSYINTLDSQGCSFKNYMKLIRDVLNFYKIEIKDEEYYLPEIFYEKLPNISKIKSNFINIKQNFNKCILISNGDVLSRQSINFDFKPIIEKLSYDFPNYLFLITKDIIHNKKNIFYTGNLTNILPDLLYISYFSTLSEVLIGRASSPYTYFVTKENLTNKDKIIISFNNKKSEGYFYENVQPKFVWSNNYDLNNIYLTIKNNI